MNTKHIALGLFLLPLAVYSFGFAQGKLSPSRVFAQSCTNQYGASVSCAPSDLTINKQVKNPVTGVFVENLGTTDAAFGPGSEVLYRLTIKNSSGETFANVNVKDTFPSYISFVAGPGTYDKTTNTLSFTLTNMIAGETRTQEILTKVSDKSAFPAGRTFVCVVNSAEVAALNRKDDDTAQACIQVEISGASTLPIAGFNDLLLILPFVGTALGGLVMLKKKR